MVCVRCCTIHTHVLQSVIVLLVFIGYGLTVVWCKPYIEPFYTYLEGFIMVQQIFVLACVILIAWGYDADLLSQIMLFCTCVCQCVIVDLSS